MNDCVFCGMPACYLYLTPLCVSCALECQITIEAKGAKGSAIVLRNSDGRTRDLVWSESISPDAPSWAPTLTARRERLHDLARDSALMDDPAFVAELPHYAAQNDWDEFSLGVLERSRKQNSVLRAAEELIRGF